MMKIATWNVNSVRAREGHLLKWLAAESPDVLMLQEIKVEAGDFPAAPVAAAGYEALVRGQKGYAGVAMVYKKGLEPRMIADTLLPEAQDQARYIEAALGDLTLICIYAPNGNPPAGDPGDDSKYRYKLDWFAAFEARMAQLLNEGKKVLAGGDYNIIPEDTDCHDPGEWAGDALFTMDVRRIYRRLVFSGYSDCYRLFDGGAGAYTFWDYQDGAWPANRGIRIDHFLASPALAGSVSACAIDAGPRGWDKPSDHTPVVLHLR